MSRPPSPLPENAPQADLMPAAPPPTSTEPASPRVSGEQRGVTSSSSHLHETDGPATRAVPSVSTAAPAPPIDTAAPLPGRSGERKTTEAASDPGKCPTCKGGGRKGRNLVVCIDGTSNQFSKKNTNVVELYSRLIKDENQLTFYNSGIGTYAEPSWKSWSYRKQVFMNMLDLMFALRLEKIIISAYAWLVDNYEEGDRIFLFGFSRGAYQVRALAAMLDIVGLLHKGNRDQIPFAFELYAASDRDRRPQLLAPAVNALSQLRESTPSVTTDPSTESLADIRESTSRCLPSLRGAFNTMSAGSARVSKGLRSAVSKVRSATAGVQILAPVRAKLSQCISLVPRPGLGAPARKFRLPQAQAQAGETSPDTDSPEITMQERFKATFSRDVKAHFLGAWDTVSSVRLIRGSTLPGTTDGMGTVCFFRHALAMHEYRVKFLPEYANGGNGPDEKAANSHNNMPPHTKEVWFIGSHSDIGGGSTVNTELDKFGPALRWMSFEAGLAGLRIKPGPRQWEEQTLVTDSMAWYYKPMEWLPVKRLTYADKKSLTLWRPHRYSERVVRPNQLIHETYLKETGTMIDDLQTEIGFEIKIEKDAYTDAQALLSVPRDQPSRDDWLQQLQILQESEPGLQSLLDLERDIWLALARSVPSYPEPEDLRRLENALVCRNSNEVDVTRRLSEVFGTSDQDTYWTYPFPLRGHTGLVSSVAFLTPQLVVSGSWDRTLRIWNIDTGEAVGDPLTGHTDLIDCVAVSPDGSLVASGSYDGTIRTWKFDAGKLVGGGLVIRADDMGPVLSVAFSPDGSRIVSGSGDGVLRIWDAETGQQVGNAMEGHDGWVRSVAFSPDGARIASGSSDRTVRLWDARTFQPLRDPLTGHTDEVNSVAFSPDGVSIASGSDDKTIRIWNSNTRELMHTLAGHSDWVTSVAFSPSGRHIASASGDDTVRIWDAVSGEAVGVLEGHTNSVYSVAFSPDGTWIASGSRDDTVRIWDRIPVSSTDAT